MTKIVNDMDPVVAMFERNTLLNFIDEKVIVRVKVERAFLELRTAASPLSKPKLDFALILLEEVQIEQRVAVFEIRDRLLGFVASLGDKITVILTAPEKGRLVRRMLLKRTDEES